MAEKIKFPLESVGKKLYTKDEFKKHFKIKRVVGGVEFLKPIARNEKLYIENGLLRYIKKINYKNNNHIIFIILRSGSGSWVCSSSGSACCGLCGYGLELI